MGHARISNNNVTLASLLLSHQQSSSNSLCSCFVLLSPFSPSSLFPAVAAVFNQKSQMNPVNLPKTKTPESWHLDGPLLLHSVRSRLTCGHCCGLLAAQIWHHRCLRCWGVDTRPDDFFFISIKKCWGGQNRANGANIEPGFIKWTK